MCGEQYWMLSRVYTPKGSPPRVRGTVLEIFQICLYFGITPACAGNSRLKF